MTNIDLIANRMVLASLSQRIAEEMVTADTLRQMKIDEIARLIRRDWKGMYFGAKPYVEAMESLQTIDDSYGLDRGSEIVAYALSNMSSWRGPLAKLVKVELNRRLKSRNGSEIEARRKMAYLVVNPESFRDSMEVREILETNQLGYGSLQDGGFSVPIREVSIAGKQLMKALESRGIPYKVVSKPFPIVHQKTTPLDG